MLLYLSRPRCLVALSPRSHNPVTCASVCVCVCVWAWVILGLSFADGALWSRRRGTCGLERTEFCYRSIWKALDCCRYNCCRRCWRKSFKLHFSMRFVFLLPPALRACFDTSYQ